MRQYFVATLAIGLSLTALGQTPASASAPPAKLPVYEVVSVKLNKGESGEMGWESTSNGVRMKNVTIMMLIRASDYALRHATDDRVTGLPTWATKEHFDIEAKVSEEDAPAFKKLTEEQQSAMFRSLMEDRFKFKAHAETREMPVYDLVIAKGGPKMTPTKAADLKDHAEGTWTIGGTVAKLDFTSMEVTALADNLTQQLGRTVVNKTGLTGKYDIKMEWRPENAPETATSTAPAIFTAIQEQLGLRLDSRKGPVEGLVVDHIEEPSAN